MDDWWGGGGWRYKAPVPIPSAIIYPSGGGVNPAYSNYIMLKDSLSLVSVEGGVFPTGE